MDRISGLPEDLLLKILDLVPTKVAVSTSILSKRWRFVWLWLRKLECVDESGLLGEFVNRNLPLHRAKAIERLLLHLSSDTSATPEDLKKWLEFAVKRSVAELDISYYYNSKAKIQMFPKGFFSCKSLKVLKLKGVFLKCVDTDKFVLPSVKTLVLDSVKYANNEAHSDLLRICPVISELSLQLTLDCRMREVTIINETLLKLSLFIPPGLKLHYGIHCPSLEYLKVEDWNVIRYFPEIHVAKLKEANVDVLSGTLEDVLQQITSVNRLAICSPDDEYSGSLDFKNLEHLTLCDCKEDYSNLLDQFLNDSPNLQQLHTSVAKVCKR